MTDILCPEPKCGHDIDFHFEGGCEFLDEVNDEYCACDFVPSDIANALLTAEPTEAEIEAVAAAIRENKTYLSVEAMAVGLLRAAFEARR